MISPATAKLLTDIDAAALAHVRALERRRVAAGILGEAKAAYEESCRDAHVADANLNEAISALVEHHRAAGVGV